MTNANRSAFFLTCVAWLLVAATMSFASTAIHKTLRISIEVRMGCTKTLSQSYQQVEQLLYTTIEIQRKPINHK
ncbi:MAG: hypothetical protein ABIQ88_17895 [Chitinophagaceae bacterium]